MRAAWPNPRFRNHAVGVFVNDRKQVQLRKIRSDVDAAPRTRSLRERALSLVGRQWLFLAMVVAPVALAGYYFAFIASNIYVSETKYVVRTPSDNGGIGNPLSGLVQSSGITKATDDAHTINAFLISRDAMDILRRSTNLDDAYSADKADFLSRYPKFSSWRTNEGLFKYFITMTTVRHDNTTGISTLSVSAFDPKDAQTIARKLIESGEALANRLSKRMRDDLVQSAMIEANFARDHALVVQQKITEWRNREAQIDPTRFSAAVIELIARLSLELAQLRAQKAEMMKASPQSPAIVSLQNRIVALEDQVANERASLAGTSSSLATKIVEYEQLQLEKLIAEKLFGATVNSLETARADAQKQQIYLERIVDPQLADYPSRPQRLLSLAIVAGISLLLFIVLRKILENISHHGAFARYFSRRGMP